MSTIHLLYSSLKYALDWTGIEKSTIVLLEKKHKIKDILQTYCYFPTVINEIIFDYTHNKIEIKCTSNLTKSDKYLWIINLKLKINDCNVIINILSDESEIKYKLNITYDDTIAHYLNNEKDYDSLSIHYINAFMKQIYNQSNYIKWSCIDDNKYFVKYNAIICMSKYNISAISINNGREFKYLIVMIKCIIRGIHKYFST